jgi:hypothetical protein
MSLLTAPYQAQAAAWPLAGEHVLAHYDDVSVVVYQAYRPSIGRFAIEHGYLGGSDFSLSRMSWVKPNFLWMMCRSGWGMKDGQEITLGLRVRRAFFDTLLEAAVPSSFDASRFPSREAWQSSVAGSEVRPQWDPDHSPSGARLERRAVQLGLRGDTLAAFARKELLEVIDLTGFVASQRPHARDDAAAALLTPVERVYLPDHGGVRQP